MFNGIIYNIGKVKSVKKGKKSCLLNIDTNLLFKKKDIGSSISCNGVCLTLVAIYKKCLSFYVSNESLKKTNLGFLKIGNIVNIENSLIYGQKISGHFIHGHVDTTAKVKKIILVAKTWVVKFQLKDKNLYKYLVEKASISINGVSLTISKTTNNYFEINIIPHSLKLTNLKFLNNKSIVNVELDIFAKYISKVFK